MTTLGSAVAALCISSLFVCSTLAADTEESSTIRVLRPIYNNGTTKIGDFPLILATYGATGRPAGGGGLMLSGDYTNVLIDLGYISRNLDPFVPMLGVQENADRSSTSVSIRRRKVEKLFINANGLGFPEPLRTIAKGGPFISITLRDAAHNVIDLLTVDLTITNPAGIQLVIVRQDHGIVLVKSVQRETLRLRASDRRNGQSWSTELFPMFRSSEPNLVLYSVNDVTIGQPLAAKPTYEDKIKVPLSKKAKGEQVKCEASDFVACNDLAVLFLKGGGAPQDSDEAARLWNKACDGGYAMACSNLGLAYFIGDGVAQDYAKARDLYLKGCDLNYGPACYNLGALYGSGLGVAADQAEMKRLMKKACDMGFQQACSLM